MEKALYLVTGAAGHLGNTVVGSLLALNQQVRALILPSERPRPSMQGAEIVEGDVCLRDSLAPFFKPVPGLPTKLIHCAGVISIGSRFQKRLFDVNVEGTRNILACCKDFAVSKLVHVSSVHAIPERPAGQTISEIDHFDPDILDGTYAKTKATATQYVLDSQCDALDVVVTHPGACCGPYDFKVSSVGEMVRMYMRGKFPVSLAFGMYNFVDVRDVAKGMHSAAQKGRPGECYILTAESISVDQLLHILADKTGIPASNFKLPLWLAQAAAPLMEVYYKAAHKTPLFTRYSLRKLTSNCNFSIEKAQKELDYHPMSARESFYDMVDWIAENEHIPLKKAAK